MKMKSKTIYCPICAKELTASKEYEDDGFVFVHDDVEHLDSDIDALVNGIN